MSQKKWDRMGQSTVVIDNGSGFCRSGFAEDEKPRSIIRSIAVFPEILGKKHCELRANRSGEASAGKRSPVKHGIVVDWDAMEILWNHVFLCELRAFPEDHAVLVTDSPTCPTTNREMMAEVFFEAFDVPALRVAHTALLSLCSYGLVSGLVVEAGAGVCHTAPVYEGEVSREATYRLDIAGKVLCKYLKQLLTDGHSLLSNLKRRTVAGIKEELCYVSLDFNKELQEKDQQRKKNFELPGGQQITLDQERFLCPEPMFKPKMLLNDSPGLHSFTFNSILKAPEAFRSKTLYRVALSGGSTMFPCFPERIRNELVSLAPEDYSFQVMASPKRSNSTWIGGSILASLSSLQGTMMTQEDYNEHGAGYVHEKFN
ncbi:actin-like [Microcaecilia unicolor]|uniref:Actin-like n=1 Tax=Microcaecilia unicolor TaxID=1415580 RepID=A0A6P7WNF3_9AMPH|nr:actin-like [Microcaecilia unicolor]XP_030042597.1 actin-like [Microcaecilia unicolor]